jgi:hypothetical protein
VTPASVEISHHRIYVIGKNVGMDHVGLEINEVYTLEVEYYPFRKE